MRACAEKRCVNPKHQRLSTDSLPAHCTAKACSKCGVEKPLEDFFVSDKRNGRRFSHCKNCEIQYRGTRKKQSNASRRRWEARNPEKSRKAKLAHYLANSEKYNEAARRYAREHPEWKREQWRKRHLRKQGVAGTHTLDEWKAVQVKQGGHCFYCGEPARLHRDHLIPITRGGSDYIANVVGACKVCNSRKNTRTVDEFVRRIIEVGDYYPPSLRAFAERYMEETPLFFLAEKALAARSNPLFASAYPDPDPDDGDEDEEEDGDDRIQPTLGRIG